MHTLAIVFLYLVIQMSCVWLVYWRTQNPSIVDVSWSLGLGAAGWIYLALSPHGFTLRTLIAALLLTIWSLRLAGYIWITRISKKHVDKRYLELSRDWKMSHALGFFFNYQFQGLLIFIISSVFLFVGQGDATGLSLSDDVAILIISIGIIGEAIADWQLSLHKAERTGTLCERGLWRYSRHPNYFFDWMTWCGFAVLGLTAAYGYLSLIAPLTLYILFNYVTGPMTERGSIKSRGEAYKAYQARTSMFFPWFTRKTDFVKK